MASLHMSPSMAAVIGDVVGSREFDDQHGLMERIREALTWANARVQPAQPLALSIRDEFQAAYERLDEALEVTALIRLRLAMSPDLRFGVGWGQIVTPDGNGKGFAGQSGSAWWRARDAIDTAKRLEKARGWPRTLRTRLVSNRPRFDSPINAFLACRDHLLSRMDGKDARIALGLFLGETQADLARELGVGQSNVSRRQADNGPAAVFRAHEELRELTR